MTNSKYRRFVEEGASSAYTPELAMLGLMGEVGELSDVVKKEAIYPDMTKFIEKYGMGVKDKIADEAGDVLWQYTLVLIKYGLTLDEVMQKNYEKLISRHGGTTLRRDGGEREE